MIDLSHGLSLSEKEKRLLDKTPDADRETRLQQLLGEFEKTSTAALGTHKTEQDTKHSLPQARIALEIAGLLLDLDRKADAWKYARPAITDLVSHQAFEDAALACQYTYLADQDDAIAAIGQAAWLSVTYPVDPHLTANILSHIIDETPEHSDGGAVAAAVAHYVVDQRSDLELDMPEKFLIRLRNVIDVLVQTDWWFDRDELLSNIPD